MTDEERKTLNQMEIRVKQLEEKFKTIDGRIWLLLITTTGGLITGIIQLLST